MDNKSTNNSTTEPSPAIGRLRTPGVIYKGASTLSDKIMGELSLDDEGLRYVCDDGKVLFQFKPQDLNNVIVAYTRLTYVPLSGKRYDVDFMDKSSSTGAKAAFWGALNPGLGFAAFADAAEAVGMSNWAAGLQARGFKIQERRILNPQKMALKLGFYGFISLLLLTVVWAIITMATET